SDPRFSADTIMAEIAKNYRLPLTERLLYRFAIIPGTRRAILRLKNRDAWMNDRPDWGRGRIDPFNPVKFGRLAQQVDATIGNSDMQPVWNLNAHAGGVFHWDGLNTNPQEVVLSSAIGDGAHNKWVERDFSRWNETESRRMSGLRRIQNCLGAARRHLAARAVPAQRIGSFARRSPEAGREPADRFLARVRRVRPDLGRIRDRRPRGRARRHLVRHDAARQQQRRPCVRHDASGR